MNLNAPFDIVVLCSGKGTNLQNLIEHPEAGRTIQTRTRVSPVDEETSLSARVQEGEYIILPRALEWRASGRLEREHGQAVLDNKPIDRPVVAENCDDV